jgi:GNAT superfamily N-acetyltransferase
MAGYRQAGSSLGVPATWCFSKGAEMTVRYLLPRTSQSVQRRSRRAVPIADSHVVADTYCWHDLEMEIRAASLEDASAACEVMRRSIAELCVADHQNNEGILKRWLSNKTPEAFESWIRQPDNSLLLAVEGGNILGVGSVTDAGQITLNYVSPDARFRGVSRALLGALEARAVERGNKRCTLTSTETARRFYRSNGYFEDGPPVGNFGTSSDYPMSKFIAS